MAVILVSNCLLGCVCRYKGDHQRCDEILALAKDHTLVGVCPEQMGGLPTPRDPAEIVDGKLISSAGADVTKEYMQGVENAMILAKLTKPDFAILKYRSPACGKGVIYDGTFKGNLIPGNGVFTQALIDAGIPVFNELELDKLPL